MKISRKQLSTLLTSPRVLTPAVFLGVGAAKTYTDYKNELSQYKNQVLVKDASVLAGASAGCALAALITNSFFKHEIFAGNKKLLKNLEYVLKQSCSSVITTFLGVAFAVLFHEPVEKFILNKFFKKTKTAQQPQIPTESKVFKDFIANAPNPAVKTAGKVFTNISDIPSMKVFSAPIAALTGFSVANTSGYDNKVKKTTKDIIANSLIPTIFVASAALFVNTKKALIKYPALLLSLAVGTVAGNYVADKTEKHINKTVDVINTKLLLR